MSNSSNQKASPPLSPSALVEQLDRFLANPAWPAGQIVFDIRGNAYQLDHEDPRQVVRAIGLLIAQNAHALYPTEKLSTPPEELAPGESAGRASVRCYAAPSDPFVLALVAKLDRNSQDNHFAAMDLLNTVHEQLAIELADHNDQFSAAEKKVLSQIQTVGMHLLTNKKITTAEQETLLSAARAVCDFPPELQK